MRKDDDKEPGFFEPRHGEERLLKPGNEGREREKAWLREKHWAEQQDPRTPEQRAAETGSHTRDLNPPLPPKAKAKGEHGHRSGGGEPARPGKLDENAGHAPPGTPHVLGLDAQARSEGAPTRARAGGTEATGSRHDYTEKHGVLDEFETRPVTGPGSREGAAKGWRVPSRGASPRGPKADNRGGGGE